MNKLRMFPFQLSLAFLFLLGSVSFSWADVINYGNFVGDTVTYIDVTENSLEPGALYGAPTIMGNTLDMEAMGFIAQAINGEVRFLDGRLTFMVEADPGYTINSITIQEFGSYFTFGEDSIASVSAVAFVETLEGGLFGDSFILNFFGLPGPVPDSDLWTNDLTITFPETTKITVTLDNRLFAFADTPGVAFIDKKGVNILIGKTFIPEPSSAAILGIGLLGLATRRRR